MVLSEKQVCSPSMLLATRISFFIAGAGFAAWAPLVPFVKQRFGLDEAALGLLLLCLGMGALIGMPLTGGLVRRFGCRRVIVGSSIQIAANLLALSYVASLPILVGALLLFGAATGTLDVAVNIHAARVESLDNKSRMSGFHGLYSVGCIAGAGGASLLLAQGLSPLEAALCVAGLMLLSLLTTARNLLRHADSAESRAFVFPRGKVVLIGILCFIMFLAEGGVLDWGALFLSQLRGVPMQDAGVGYTLFAVAMSIGRLIGDRLVVRFGRYPVVLAGSLIAAAGFFSMVFIPAPLANLAGFVCIGLGLANIVPILISATAKQHDMPPELAIAATTTMGYSGILIGPAFLGGLAQLAGLAAVFFVLGVLVLCITVFCRVVLR